MLKIIRCLNPPSETIDGNNKEEVKKLTAGLQNIPPSSR